MSTFTCPRCGRTSHNPNDAEQGYCGACHDWTAGPPMSEEPEFAILQSDLARAEEEIESLKDRLVEWMNHASKLTRERDELAVELDDVVKENERLRARVRQLGGEGAGDG